MKKKKQLNNNLNYPLIGVVVFSLIAIVYILMMSHGSQNISYPTPAYTPTQTTQPKIFQSSKTMKFSIVVPYNYEVIEKFGSVTINTSVGEIYIDRSGTNFETLETHLDNLSKLNHFTILNKEDLTINNLPAVRCAINGKKHYFIYGAPWTVYSLFTSSPALFDDLDTIAQSFRYAL